MKFFNIKFLFIALTLLAQVSTSGAFAQEVAVSNVVNEIESVLDYQEGAIDLKQLESMVLNDNTEVKIAYERLFQAQKHIANARAAYFPYGVGTVTAAYFTSSFTYLILAELALSLPSKMFTVQKFKHLRTAERYNVKAVEANIKNQTALIYYSFLKQEALLSLASKELNLLEQLIQAKENEIMFGLATVNDLRKLKLRYYSIKDSYLVYRSYFLEARKSLNILIGREMSDKVIELQHVSKFTTIDDVKLTPYQIVDLSVSRSNEIKAANYVIKAARANRRSVKWSVISFSGIGFGYGARVKISSSQVREAILRREQVENNIRNNAVTSYSNLLNFISVLDNDRMLYSTTKNLTEGDLAEYNNGQMTKSDMISNSMFLLKDLRELVRTHYDALIKKDDLERSVLGELDVNKVLPVDLTLKIERKRKKIEISIENGSDKDIQFVEYSFDRNIFRNLLRESSKSNYKVKLKTRRKSTVVIGQAKVTMKNGEVIYKKFEIL